MKIVEKVPLGLSRRNILTARTALNAKHSTCTLVRIKVIFPTHMSSEKLIKNARYAGIN